MGSISQTFTQEKRSLVYEIDGSYEKYYSKTMHVNTASSSITTTPISDKSDLVKKVTFNPSVIREKEFKPCESLLTELMRSNHAIALKNMLTVFGIFYCIQTIANDFKTYNRHLFLLSLYGSIHCLALNCIA